MGCSYSVFFHATLCFGTVAHFVPAPGWNQPPFGTPAPCRLSSSPSPKTNSLPHISPVCLCPVELQCLVDSLRPPNLLVWFPFHPSADSSSLFICSQEVAPVSFSFILPFSVCGFTLQVKDVFRAAEKLLSLSHTAAKNLNENRFQKSPQSVAAFTLTHASSRVFV